MKLLITTFITLTLISTSLLFADTNDLPKLYLEKCNKGNLNACNDLGDLYYNGVSGVKIDYIKAYELYSFACDKNSFDGCINLADMYAEGKGVKQNYDKALTIYSNACQISIGTIGCIEFGRLYLSNQARNSNQQKDLNSFTDNCDSNDSDCIDYSELYDKLCLVNPKPFCPKSKYK